MRPMRLAFLISFFAAVPLLAQEAKPLAVLEGHERTVVAVGFSHDGRVLASASLDGVVRLWDVAKGKETAVLKGLAQRDGNWQRVAFSADAKTVVVAGSKGLNAWDVATGKEKVSRPGRYIALSDDARLAASIEGKDEGVVWDVMTGEKQGTFRGPLLSAAFSPDGKHLAIINDRVSVWDIAAGKVVQTFNLKAELSFTPEEEPRAGLCYSGDGKKLFGVLTMTGGGTRSQALSLLVELDQAAGRIAWGVRGSGGQPGPSATVLLTPGPDGKTLAYSTNKGNETRFTLLDLTTRRDLCTLGGALRCRCAALSPDGRLLAFAGTDKVVTLREVGTTREKAAKSLTAQLAKEPVVQGRPISGWMDDLKGRALCKQARKEAAVALGRLGPKDHAAVPYLVEGLTYLQGSDAMCCMPGMMTMGRPRAPQIDIGVALPAAEALGRIGEPAVPALIKSLRTSEDATWVETALARVGPAAVPALVELLKAKEPARIRLRAASALGGMGEEAEAALPALADLLKDKDAAVKSRTTLALGEIVGVTDNLLVRMVEGKIGPLPPLSHVAKDVARTAVPALVELLRDKDDDVRSHAVLALAAFGPEAKAALPALKELLKEDQSLFGVLGAYAAFAMARVGPEGQTALVEVVRNVKKEPEVAQRAAFGLIEAARSGSTDALPVLLDYLKGAGKPLEEQFLILASLASMGPRAKDALPLLRNWRDESKDKDQRKLVDEMIEKISAPPPRPLSNDEVQRLVKQLASDKPEQRAEAAAQLGQAGPKSRDATSALEAALKDTDADVRRSAREALRQIKSP